MSHVMRKLDTCLCENKGAVQLCSNCTADQRLCFSYTESTISLLLEVFKISSFLLLLCRPVCVGPDRNSRRPIFSRRGSFGLFLNISN